MCIWIKRLSRIEKKSVNLKRIVKQMQKKYGCYYNLINIQVLNKTRRHKEKHLSKSTYPSTPLDLEELCLCARCARDSFHRPHKLGRHTGPLLCLVHHKQQQEPPPAFKHCQLWSREIRMLVCTKLTPCMLNL